MDGNTRECNSQKSRPSWVLSEASGRSNLITWFKTHTVCFASIIFFYYFLRGKKKKYTHKIKVWHIFSVFANCYMGEGCELQFFKLCIKKKKNQVVISNLKRNKRKVSYHRKPKGYWVRKSCHRNFRSGWKWCSERTRSSLEHRSNSQSFCI